MPQEVEPTSFNWSTHNQSSNFGKILHFGDNKKMTNNKAFVF
jgi:hypothetical protein